VIDVHWVKSMLDVCDVGDVGGARWNAHVLRALRAGAAGFLVKDTPPDELVLAIRHAAQGRPVLSPEVTRRLIDRVAGTDQDARRDAARRKLNSLAERERTVAIELGAGRSNAEIAARHHISLAPSKPTSPRS
jgi:DNA-binding NarL/FixJ family response regulator